jgi:hypothetical protein
MNMGGSFLGAIGKLTVSAWFIACFSFCCIGQVKPLQSPSMMYGQRAASIDASSYPSLQAALNAAGVGGSVFVPRNTYVIADTLHFYSGQRITCQGGGQFLKGQTYIRFTGRSGAVVAAADQTTDNINVTIENCGFDGGPGADRVIDLTRTSYSRISSNYITGEKKDAVGILLDAQDQYKCYFNLLDQDKVDMPYGTDIVFRNGANANVVIGGKLGNAQTGMAFANHSSGNTVVGTDFEDNAVQHVSLPPSNTRNSFFAVHMETAPVGINNGAAYTVISDPSFASTVNVPIADTTHNATIRYTSPRGEGEQSVGLWRQRFTMFSRGTAVFLDPLPLMPTGDSTVNLFEAVDTTGAVRYNFYKGNGTGTVTCSIDAAKGNLKCSGTLIAPSYQTTLATPQSSSSTCTQGQMWADANYVYVCTQTNSIKRARLESF